MALPGYESTGRVGDGQLCGGKRRMGGEDDAYLISSSAG